MGIENIGNNILRLRKNKGVTQDVLAEFIGVTKTSVSKWETGTTLPDIQTLPLLASYFEVSIDELIDYVPMLNREQIRFHYSRLAQAFADRPFADVLTECEELIKKYYSCYPFLEQMVVLFLNHAGAADNEELKTRIIKITSDTCEHILADCQDINICQTTTTLRCTLNLLQGRADLVIQETEEALNPESVDNMSLGSLFTMACLMSGKTELAQKAAQIGMYKSLMNLVGYGTYLIQAKESDIPYCLSLFRRLDSILDVFSLVKLNPNTVAVYEYQAAICLANRINRGMQTTDGNKTTLKDIGTNQEDTKIRTALEDEIFLRLEKYVSAVKQLFADDIRLHGDSFFTCLDDWFEELTLGRSAVRSGRSVRESALLELANPVFSVLQNQNRLKKLTEEIQNA